jgi:hypothetical protein
MEADRARSIAERVHLGDRDPDGEPVLEHVERVVRATPAAAQPIAWLHEVLERGVVTEQELLAEGLSSDQLRALRLVTTPTWTRSDRVYLAHVELIARAAGWSGEVAREVKVADLRDACVHLRASSDGWSPPYAEALRRLGGSHDERRLQRAVTPGTQVALDAAGASAVRTG